MEDKCCRCGCDSVTFLCDSCLAVFRKNGVILKSKEEYEMWPEIVDDLVKERKIKRDLCDAINY